MEPLRHFNVGAFEVKVFEGTDCYWAVLYLKGGFLFCNGFGNSPEEAIRALQKEMNVVFQGVHDIERLYSEPNTNAEF